MVLMGLLAGLLPDGADGNRFAEDCVQSFSEVPLIRRQVLDATSMMLAVVPLHRTINPGTPSIQVAKPAQRHPG